jgi:protoheme IX farnesyltransferase
MISKAESYSPGSYVVMKLKAYFELVKFRLSFLVSFSSAFGYLLGSNSKIDWNHFLWFTLGGFLISGSALTINQVLEKDFDKMMIRTMNRPLPTQRISVIEALLFALLTFSAGILLIAEYANSLTTILATVSLILYAFIYTPLKRVGPVAVFVGALPGAFPPLLGWIAATGEISMNAVIIFLIQFIWQFPHFWAIAWLADEDYKRAGFKLLPGKGLKNTYTSVQIIIFTFLLVPAGLLPWVFHVSGMVSAVILALAGMMFLYQSVNHLRTGTRDSALKIMYSSFIYLPVIQIALLITKI